MKVHQFEVEMVKQSHLPVREMEMRIFTPFQKMVAI